MTVRGLGLGHGLMICEDGDAIGDRASLTIDSGPRPV
jgi:hypothetical protein